jgi:DNA-binding MarR family transcriptional regulator
MRSARVGIIDLLKRAELAVRSRMEVALSEFGLTPAQFLMLFRLRSALDLSVADIARELGVRPQSIIQIIGPLEHRGLVKRERRPGHRRILRTRLTATGHALVHDALLVAARVEMELLAQVGGEQTLGLRHALTKLLQSAETHALRRKSIRVRTMTPMRQSSKPNVWEARK